MEKNLQVNKVDTRMNVADLFTKPVVGTLYKTLITQLGMKNMH